MVRTHWGDNRVSPALSPWSCPSAPTLNSTLAAPPLQPDLEQTMKPPASDVRHAHPTESFISRAEPLFSPPIHPSVSFLSLSHSMTSLSTTHSACSIDISNSMGYTSDGRWDFVYCVKQDSSAGGSESEVQKVLLGPRFVRNSAPLYVLTR